MEYNSYLIHHGIKGQKWYRRRYQNEDGTLTAEGREHYGYENKREAANEKYRVNRTQKSINRFDTKINKLNAKSEKLQNKINSGEYTDKRVSKMRSRLKTYNAEKEFNMAVKDAELKKLASMDVSEIKRSDRIEFGKKAATHAIAALSGATIGAVAGYHVGKTKMSKLLLPKIAGLESDISNLESNISSLNSKSEQYKKQRNRERRHRLMEATRDLMYNTPSTSHYSSYYMPTYARYQSRFV